MATSIQEMRHRVSERQQAYAAEMAKYSDENLPTPEQAAHIDELRGEYVTAQKELQSAEQFAQNQKDWERQQEEISRRTGRPPVEAAEQLRRRGFHSVGSRFVENPAYKDWLAMVAPNGRFAERSVLNSPALHFGGLPDLARSAELLTGSDQESAGALIIPDQYTPITELGRRPLTIRDVITNLQTDSDMVEYVRITEENSNAAVVPEASATSADHGENSGIKPESGMAFERIPTPVKTIAHWMPATTRALSDASQLRGLIDSFLRYGVELELEDQIVTGDGIGENFEGILATDGIQEQAFVGDLFRTTRQARRKVRTIGRRRPSAFLFNPIDWEEIELQQDGQQRYYYGGPIGMGPEQLWRLPVIESEAVPEGTGLVADWSTCVLWDRQQASVSVSNSHADFFIRNMVAVLCELRAAFGVLKPNAIVAIDLNGGHS